MHTKDSGAGGEREYYWPQKTGLRPGVASLSGLWTQTQNRCAWLLCQAPQPDSVLVAISARCADSLASGERVKHFSFS